MKRFYLLLILTIVAIALSCMREKDNILQEKDIEFRTDTLDYEDCSAILDSVYKLGNMLVFNDSAHFEKCAMCLEYYYENYNSDYEDDYPGATAEELDSLDIINNFDQWIPYIQFESNLSFSSLRAKIEEEFTDWLSSTDADSIDWDDDPEKSVPVMSMSYKALLNEDGYAKVGSDTISMDDWADYDEGDCSWLKTNTYVYDYSDDPLLLNRQIKMEVKIRSNPVCSYLKGSITHLKKVNGKYERTRAKIRIAVYGAQYDIYCDKISWDPWYNFKGYENRSYLSVSDSKWKLWRQALTNTSHKDWPLDKCSADGFYLNDNNYYPVYLEQ